MDLSHYLLSVATHMLLVVKHLVHVPNLTFLFSHGAATMVEYS